MRLDKYLTQAGFGTRSRVKEYIRRGLVTVDGQVEKSPDRRIAEEGAAVVCQGRAAVCPKTLWYMLHKPKGFVCATKDTRERTVMELLGGDARRDLFPVGRLDKDTEGLLLVTNDGQTAHRLLSPAGHVPKKYLARLSRAPEEAEIERLETGLDIGGGRPTRPASFAWKDRERAEAYLTVTEGRFHQVKRMFGALGIEVLSLKRLEMGGLALDEGLSPGEYRPLRPKEIEELQKRC